MGSSGSGEKEIYFFATILLFLGDLAMDFGILGWHGTLLKTCVFQVCQKIHFFITLWFQKRGTGWNTTRLENSVDIGDRDTGLGLGYDFSPR